MLCSFSGISTVQALKTNIINIWSVFKAKSVAFRKICANIFHSGNKKKAVIQIKVIIFQDNLKIILTFSCTCPANNHSVSQMLHIRTIISANRWWFGFKTKPSISCQCLQTREWDRQDAQMFFWEYDFFFWLCATNLTELRVDAKHLTDRRSRSSVARPRTQHNKPY